MIHYNYYNSEEEKDFLLERISRCSLLKHVKKIEDIGEEKSLLFTDVDIFLSAREDINNLMTVHVIVDRENQRKFLNSLRWFKKNDIKYCNDDDPTTGKDGMIHSINEDNIRFREDMQECRRLSRDCRILTSQREYLKLRIV